MTSAGTSLQIATTPHRCRLRGTGSLARTTRNGSKATLPSRARSAASPILSCAAARISATRAAERVEFIYENDSRRLRSRLIEQVSTNSDPLIEKTARPLGQSTARADRVSRCRAARPAGRPRGCGRPADRTLRGFPRKATISQSSPIASSTPATSLKVTFVSDSR